MKFSAKTLAALFLAVAGVVALPQLILAGPPEINPADAEKARVETSPDGRLSAFGVELTRRGGEPCENGSAAGYECENVDLQSFVPIAELESSFINDVWGWAKDGRHFAIVGSWEGTAFVEVTDAENPIYLGTLPSEVPASAPFTEGSFDGVLWGDIRVHDDVAYIVDDKPGHGVQVFDLTQLLTANGPQDWKPQQVLSDMDSHNVSLNTDSEILYVLGSNISDTTVLCGDDTSGGPILYDVSTALEPEFIGCFDDGLVGPAIYTHDAQCVTYAGPDLEFTGREICVGSNQTDIVVWDMTETIAAANRADPPPPAVLSVTKTLNFDPFQYYVHQGALSEDQDIFFLGDELDEFNGITANRTTYIYDMSDLRAPVLINDWEAPSTSIDHNMFVNEGLLYQANYTDGLSVLDPADAANGELELVGNFDIIPGTDAPTFDGAWGVYPNFGNDKILLTSVVDGLYVLSYDPETDPEPGTGVVTGTILSEDGQGVADVVVDVFVANDDGSRGVWLGDTRTDADGAYRFELEAGDHVLTAIAPSGREFVGGSRYAQGPVTVVSGETVNGLDATLAGDGQDDGAITGTIGDGSGGVEGVVVDLFAATGDGSRGLWLGDTATDASGDYGFEVPPGCYVVTMIAPDGRVFENGSQWNQPAQLCVDAGETVPDIDGLLK